MVGKLHSLKPGCFALKPVRTSSISTSLTDLPSLTIVFSSHAMKCAMAAPSTMCARLIPSISAGFLQAFIGVTGFWALTSDAFGTTRLSA